MQKSSKTSSAPIVVSKPFLTGNPVDTTTAKSALLIFGSLLVVAVLYLIVCSMMMFDSLVLRILVNGLVVVLTLAVFYQKEKIWMKRALISIVDHYLFPPEQMLL